MTRLVWNGLPILSGMACAYIFSLPVNVALSGIAIIIAGSLLWSTRNAELGALLGMFAGMLAALFLVGMWLTAAVIYGIGVDLSWLLRSTST